MLLESSVLYVNVYNVLLFFTLQADLDLFSGDLLECALNEANINSIDFLDNPQLELKTKETYSDHDYYAQKSPTNSDSGVSMSSSGNAYSPQSVTMDQQYSPQSSDQQISPRSGDLSGSPRSESNIDVNLGEQNNMLSLDDLDMKDINMEGIDTEALISATDEDFLKELCSSANINPVQQTSISFGKESFLSVYMEIKLTEGVIFLGDNFIYLTP